MRGAPRKAPNFGAGAVEYDLGSVADEEAHDPPHDVWWKAMHKEGGRGAAVVVEVIDLAA